MMKYIKFITIIVLLIFAFVLLFAYKDNEHDFEINEAFISIDNNNFIEVKNDEWKYVSSDDLLDFEWQKFNIYSGKSFLGNFYIQFNERWYIFDDDNNSIKYDDVLFMIRGTEVQFYDFDFQNISDNEYDDIINLLDDLNISYDENNLNCQKIYIDADGDGSDELLFTVNNTSYEEENGDLFSLIYLLKDSKKYFLEKSVQDSDSYYKMPYYDVSYIANIGNSDSYKFIIYKSYFSSTDEKCYSVYEFKDDKLTTLLEAELVYDENENINTDEREEINIGAIILTFSLLGGIVGVVILMFYLKQKANNEI